MANRLFSRHTQKLSSFGRSLRALSFETRPSRDYSNQSWRRKNTYVEQVLFGHTGERQVNTVWPDPNLGCLGPKDRRFNLPGNVGVDNAVIPSEKEKPATPEQIQADKKAVEDEVAFWKNLCDSPTNYQRQVGMLKHHEQVEKLQEHEMAAIERSIEKERFKDLECIAQSCPDLLRRELSGMFMTVNITTGPLTAITLCHKTQNDMSAWSPDVEDERDALVEHFINTAKELCQELRTRAQWADFIEPTSGRPFYGAYTNLTFFETDERYRHLGFRIEDLGCCKVIAHHKWGTHAFVGTIFTTAPHDSEYLEQIMKNYNASLKLP